MAERSVLTVQGRTESEKIIERSRFLTYSTHVESEEEARAFIAQIRSEHSLATHVCYAFVADKLGNLQRFSDDGEPQGTAGVPMLDVLKNKKLFETAVAVVRYFGGVKLGAGGLVRAYSSCVAENLALAEICSLEPCVEYAIEVDYTGIDGVQKYLSSRPCSLISADYGAKVLFQVAVKKTDGEAFESGLIDYLQGRVEIAACGEYYRAFKVE
ncbi:MAG: YigZ family protein [Clostridia bacterium]|nr:YigZ family protein [Clostridia bacterium]